jgi:hypothetical protein
MRTTVDIDDPILREVKAVGEERGVSLGRAVSDLLAEGLRARRAAPEKKATPRWIARRMKARVDIADKDALFAALEPGKGSAEDEGSS